MSRHEAFRVLTRGAGKGPRKQRVGDVGLWMFGFLTSIWTAKYWRDQARTTHRAVKRIGV